MRKWGIAAVAIALTALLIWQHDALLKPQPKPGVSAMPERQVLRIWVCEGWTGSTAWLERQCAAFERAHPGVNLRIRRAQVSELLEAGAVLPDMLVFAPGVLADPEPLLTLIHGQLPARAELCAAGRWCGQQWALPVAMGGYALLVNSEGYRDPEQSALNQDTLEAAAQPARGKQPARYALQCAQGDAQAYPVALLAQGGAMRGGWPQGIAAQRGQATLPTDFALCTPEKAFADFVARRAMAMICTQRDLRRFSALTEVGKGFDFRVEPAKEAFTDQLLMVGVLKGTHNAAIETLCAQLLWQLVGTEAQQALTEYGLFPVRADVPGYDAQTAPWLHAMAQALATEQIWVPNAFSWTDQRKDFFARTDLALAQGGVDLTASGIW